MDEPQNKRDDKGRLLPGASLNPGGSRKIPPEILDMLKAGSPRAARVLIEAMEADKPVVVGGEVQMFPDWAIRKDAARTIHERLYGKAVQAVTGEDGGPIQVDMGLLTTLQGLTRKPEDV